MPAVARKKMRVCLRTNEVNARARADLSGILVAEDGSRIPYCLKPEVVTEVEEEVYTQLYIKFHRSRQRLAPDIHENLRNPHDRGTQAAMRNEYIQRPIIEFLDGPPSK